MDPQKFFQDKLDQVIKMGALYATPGPGAVKVLTQLEGSTPQANAYNPGPLLRFGNPFAGEPLVGINQERRVEKPMSAVPEYSPGSYEARVR